MYIVLYKERRGAGTRYNAAKKNVRGFVCFRRALRRNGFRHVDITDRTNHTVFAGAEGQASSAPTPKSPRNRGKSATDGYLLKYILFFVLLMLFV